MLVYEGDLAACFGLKWMKCFSVDSWKEFEWLRSKNRTESCESCHVPPTASAGDLPYKRRSP